MILLTLDTSRFELGLRRLREVSRRTSAQIVNQASLDVAGQCWETMPPGINGAAPAKRRRIKSFLDAQLAQRVRQTEKGRFIRAGKAAEQLRRKHLIANYWRGKAGKRGLYGQEMVAYSGAMSRKRQIGVGALMAPFLPIIRGLNRVAKFKYPFAKTREAHVAIWPGSAGSGVSPARNKPSPTAILSIRTGVRTSQEGRVGRLMSHVIQAALNWKAGKLMRQAERELLAQFDKV